MAAKVSKERENSLSFEERLEKLETLAQRMEQGNLPLQELLKDYEEGMQLSSALQGELAQAKARMMEIKLGGGPDAKPKPSDVVQQATLLDGLDLEEPALDEPTGSKE